MAAQKAEAQRRLMRPNKRVEVDTTDFEKKRISVERKKDELVCSSYSFPHCIGNCNLHWSKIILYRESFKIVNNEILITLQV